MQTKGTIEVNGLRLFARHGVMPQEREVGNEFEVSVKIEVEMGIAMTDDILDGTVNYADIVDTIKNEMDIPSMLLENVAWRIGEALRKRYPHIKSGTVRVAKPTPPIPAQIREVAVTLSF